MQAKKRVDLKLGFSCNNDCLHCVVADKRKLPERSTEQCKKHLKEAKENGAEEAVLTGGEPTIREDLIELVSYAKDLRYSLIQLQTNARQLSDEKYLGELMDSGVNEFVPAIQAHKAEIHDKIVRRDGAFDETKGAIQLMREIGGEEVSIIANSVLQKMNYKILPELAEFLIDLDVDSFQFAYVHPMGNARKYFDKVIVEFSEAAPYVHEALDKARKVGVVPKVEAIPFCWMVGYEGHVTELYIPKTELRELDKVIEDFDKLRKTQAKVKLPKCRECKYFEICEGPWKEYVEHFGKDILQPIEGQEIKNPDKFRIFE